MIAMPLSKKILASRNCRTFYCTTTVLQPSNAGVQIRGNPVWCTRRGIAIHKLVELEQGDWRNQRVEQDRKEVGEVTRSVYRVVKRRHATSFSLTVREH